MFFEETVQFFRRVDAWRAIGYVLAGLGDVARAQGLREPARERLLESLAHFREARDPMGTAFALNRLGPLAGALGEHDLGREWLEEGLALRRELGDRRGVGMTLGNLGILAARAGDLERGRALIGEALALFEETDDAPGQMGMRLNLGHLAADAGEREARPRAARGHPRDGRRRSACSAAWGGRRSRWPSWPSPTATRRARPSCSTRRSRACGRSATAGASRGPWSSAKRPLRGR